MDNLNLIADPLNKKLMQGRRNALICMNPIPPKNQIVVTLHLRDEESRSKHLAPNGELQGSNSLGAKGLAPSNTTNRHVCLDQVLVLATMLLVQRIGHKICNAGRHSNQGLLLSGGKS